MDLTEQEQRAIRDLSDVLRGRFGAIEVTLFGSGARGQMDGESDIDLFVVVPVLDWTTELAMYDAAFDASLSIDRAITLSVFTREQVETSPIRASGLVQRVRKEGRPA